MWGLGEVAKASDDGLSGLADRDSLRVYFFDRKTRTQVRATIAQLIAQEGPAVELIRNGTDNSPAVMGGRGFKPLTRIFRIRRPSGKKDWQRSRRQMAARP